MTKPILIALGAGIASAAVLIAFMIGGPGGMVLVNLTPLPLMMVGLALGVVPARVAGAGGTVFAALMSGGMGAAIFLAVFAAPSWLVVRQALLNRPAGGAGGGTVWYPVGSIVSLLAALVAAALVIGIVFGVGLQEDLRRVVSRTVEQALAAMAPGMESQARTEAAALVAPLFPGTVGTSWILMLVVNGVLAQGLLVKAGRNLRPKTRYAALTLPDWSSWLLVAAAAVALLGAGNLEYIGQNLALVLALPFFFLGLAVAHTLMARLPQWGMALGAMYVIVFISGWAALVVVGAGLIEQWAGIRRRFAGGSQPDDDGDARGTG